MKPPLFDLSPEAEDNLYNVIVETPKGSTSKFKYEPKSGLFLLHRAMPKGTIFPYDYGFIPGTLGGDGDAVDALILNDTDSFVGCLLQARLIGVMEGRQKDTGKRETQNDCLIAIAATSIAWEKILHLRELPKRLLTHIEQFFIFYRRLQGKHFRPTGQRSTLQAYRLIKNGSKRYRKSQLPTQILPGGGCHPRTSSETD